MNSIYIQPLANAVNGALHVVEVSGQTTDRVLQLSDLLSVT